MTQKLSELFDVRYGNSLELNRLRLSDTENGIAFVSRKMRDNGIAAYVERLDAIEPSHAGELTCALSGNGILSTFIQQRDFYTGYHVAVLRPIVNFSTQELLFYCLCIKSNRYRYSYGRQANRSLKELLVPSPSEIPDWAKTVDIERFTNADAKMISAETPSLDTSKLKPFRIAELFDVKKGKRLTKGNQLTGATPFIGAVDKNNGITAFVSRCPIHTGGTITVNYNGSVAEAFWQPSPFWASDDVNVLYPRFQMNSYLAMFLITVIRQEKYRFNYGRKWHTDRMKQTELHLPSDASGQPDWAFMESYIKTLSYSSQI